MKIDQPLEILNEDKIVAAWDGKQMTLINEQFCPFYLSRRKDFEGWLRSRAIDGHRTHARLIKRILRLSLYDDVQTVLKSYAATITDNYWVRPANSQISHENVRFKENYFDDLALKGDSDAFAKASAGQNDLTPELTNIGSFEKCWKKEDGKWLMYKSANENEKKSELFICELGKFWGINMAEYYDVGPGLIKTPDFTNGASVNFEPAESFLKEGEDSDYNKVFEAIKLLSPALLPDYVRMIFLDAVCYNPDRHPQNYGFLRDKDTGHVSAMAPLFDHNLVLVSAGWPDKINKDLLIDDFNELIKSHPVYQKCLPQVKEDDVRRIAGKYWQGEELNRIVEIILKRSSMVSTKER